MALDLGAIDELFDASMVFTIKDKEYKAPPVSGAVGLWIKKIAVRQAELGPDATEEELVAAREECGPPPVPEDYTQADAMLSKKLVEQLLADGVDLPMIDHLSMVAFTRVLAGDELAKLYAHSDGHPKAPVNRAARRAVARQVKAAIKKAPAKTASGSKTTSTEKAATTRKAASGSGTRSPRAAKAASPGGKS